jgi:hypothetical protein
MAMTSRRGQDAQSLGRQRATSPGAGQATGDTRAACGRIHPQRDRRSSRGYHAACGRGGHGPPAEAMIALRAGWRGDRRMMSARRQLSVLVLVFAVRRAVSWGSVQDRIDRTWAESGWWPGGWFWRPGWVGAWAFGAESAPFWLNMVLDEQISVDGGSGFQTWVQQFQVKMQRPDPGLLLQPGHRRLLRRGQGPARPAVASARACHCRPRSPPLLVRGGLLASGALPLCHEAHRRA